MAWLRQRYAPLLGWSLRHKAAVIGGAALLVVACGLLTTRLGSEFIPNLDEGDITVQALRIPGTSLTQSVAMQKTLERTLARFPEVERVFGKIGTAEVASDPMPPSIADTFVMLKPREDWPDPRKPKDDLLERWKPRSRSCPATTTRSPSRFRCEQTS